MFGDESLNFLISFFFIFGRIISVSCLDLFHLIDKVELFCFVSLIFCFDFVIKRWQICERVLKFDTKFKSRGWTTTTSSRYFLQTYFSSTSTAFLKKVHHTFWQLACFPFVSSLRSLNDPRKRHRSKFWVALIVWRLDISFYTTQDSTSDLTRIGLPWQWWGSFVGRTPRVSL